LSATGPLEGAPSEGSQGPTRPPLAAPVRLLDWAVKAAMVIAIGMVLVFTVVQVADRYVLKSSFFGYDQFARIGLVWLTFLGIAVGIRDRTNIRIELLNHLAPRNVRRALSLVLDIVILVVSILLVVVGVRLLDVGSFHAIMGTDLNYNIMYAALLTGLGLLILFLVLRFTNLLCGGRLNIEAPVIDDDYRD
jgi:TRAP-type C4-dicarboxylate transport system permease small subunit